MAPTVQHTATRIEDEGDGFRVIMPAPRVGCATVFLSVWLVGWFAGEVSVLKAILGGLAGPSGVFTFVSGGFLLFWLAGWTAGGLFALCSLAFFVDGREIVTLGGGIIRRRVEAFRWGLSWSYDLARASNLRTAEDTTGAQSFLRFDYAADKGAKTVRFGTGLSEKMARAIAEKAWGRFPDLVPPREASERAAAATVGRVPDVPAPGAADA